MDEVLSVCQEHGKNLGDCSKQRPNKGWLLKVLSTLKPEHYFFAKAYMPAPRPRKREAKKLDNTDDFFSGLPARHRYTKVSRRTVNMLLSKQEDLPVPPHVGKEPARLTKKEVAAQKRQAAKAQKEEEKKHHVRPPNSSDAKNQGQLEPIPEEVNQQADADMRSRASGFGQRKKRKYAEFSEGRSNADAASSRAGVLQRPRINASPAKSTGLSTDFANLRT